MGSVLPWRFVRLFILVWIVAPLIVYTAVSLSWRQVRISARKGFNIDVGHREQVVSDRSPFPRSADLHDKRNSNLFENQDSKKDAKSATPDGTEASSRVHAFYYPWYAAPSKEGKFLHWNHPILPFWGKPASEQKVVKSHKPPDDIGAQFYPELGPYSSRSQHIIANHMKQMNSAGIGVAVVSWYPHGKADPNGEPSDDVMPLLLNAGHEHGVRIAFHLEPYEPRTAEDVRRDLEYIIDSYGTHPAFYRTKTSADPKARALPVVYAYDSYKIAKDDWRTVLTPGGKSTIRSTKYDCFMIGLVVNKDDLRLLNEAGFDGSYTYFASISFTFGSNPQNWKYLNEVSAKLNMMFIPSVGPGYDDTALRPWNSATTQARDGGRYYSAMIASALEMDVEAISITSFNEWGEGTQIEPAVSYTPSGGGRVYLDYLPLKPDGYLQLTLSELKHFVPARLF